MYLFRDNIKLNYSWVCGIFGHECRRVTQIYTKCVHILHRFALLFDRCFDGWCTWPGLMMMMGFSRGIFILCAWILLVLSPATQTVLCYCDATSCNLISKPGAIYIWAIVEVSASLSRCILYEIDTLSASFAVRTHNIFGDSSASLSFVCCVFCVRFFF